MRISDPTQNSVFAFTFHKFYVFMPVTLYGLSTEVVFAATQDQFLSNRVVGRSTAAQLVEIRQTPLFYSLGDLQ